MGVDETKDFEALMKSANLTFDVILTFTAAGNLTKVKNLPTAYKAARIFVSGLEIGTSIIDIVLNYTDSCQGNEEFCKSLKQYIFWVQVASFSSDLLVERMIKKSAREALSKADVNSPNKIKEHLEIFTSVFGKGPVEGVIEVSNRVKSVKAFKNYFPKYDKIYDCQCVEFIYDWKQKIFVVGQPKSIEGFIGLSPHQKLQKTINGNEDHILGGIYKRDGDKIITNENSGHFGDNWNEELRNEFKVFIEGLTGQKVQHEAWKN